MIKGYGRIKKTRCFDCGSTNILWGKWVYSEWAVDGDKILDDAPVREDMMWAPIECLSCGCNLIEEVSK